MRRLAFMLLAGFAWTLAACTTAAETGPALWRISDADSEIWLFGSVHVLPASLKWRTARIDAALASADEMVMETNVSDDGREAFAALTRRLGALPEGETLSRKLDAATQARLRQVATAAHIDPAAFEHTRPWLAALQLSITYAIAHGQDPNAGVENVLLADARAQGKRLSYFETPEQQLRILADLAPEDEMRFFVATLNDVENETDSMDEAEAAWVRGDVRRLGRLLDPELHEAGPNVYAALMTNRNARWADEIVRRLNGSGKIFIVVGAGHLAGEGSVIALLRARGVRVEGP
ncbi:MAG TPA: TraB/GumN family protein [Caulobacterales bacterium]|nr:TraB/GumN family protein [Caulobacterales bacterium]